MRVRRGYLGHTVLVCALTAQVALAPFGSASAQDSDAKARAAQHFKSAERAYDQKRFSLAAREFEAANQLVPHPAAQFNAARAHAEASEWVQAAEWFESYLQEHAGRSAERDQIASEFLADLKLKLGRLEVEGQLEPGDRLSLEGEAIKPGWRYLLPGDYVLVLVRGEQEQVKEFRIAAGEQQRISIEEMGEPAGEESAPEVLQGESAGGLAPGWFYGGLGLTAVFGLATVWSGLDTNATRSDYDESPSPELWESGESKQSRTNFLLGATVVTAVASAALGLWLVDWGGSGAERQAGAREGIFVSPGEIKLISRF